MRNKTTTYGVVLLILGAIFTFVGAMARIQQAPIGNPLLLIGSVATIVSLILILVGVVRSEYLGS